MDAHNAAESDQTKAADAPPRPTSQRSPAAALPEAGEAVSSADKESQGQDASTDLPDDRDSDAETIVLDGKVIPSPSKARKVRQEDKSDLNDDTSKGNGKTSSGNEDHDKPSVRTDESGVKKKPSVLHDSERTALAKNASSALSSAPTSPSRIRRRRPSVNSRSSGSEDEQTQEKPHGKNLPRGRPKSGDILLSNKRKAPRTDSDEDEDDWRKSRRQRTTSAGFESGRITRERRASTSKAHHDVRNRSSSPPHRSHRRSASTQLNTHHSTVGRKKRLPPPPLHPTDYHSDDSSASGSPHPRTTKARSLAASSAGDNLSPAKMPSHKKHLDAHGQTLLARACARGEFDGAKQRLRSRPQDLNVADYAGNTPLQIAAINGCEDIVKLLIDAGCSLDCVNYDKDTPLLDAVDNGHLGVIKLLLDAGVNPRKANVNGEEPIDRVTEDTDNADEIRAALIEAKKRFGGRTKTSEDRHSHLDSHDAPDSPRHSPAAAQASGRRSGTVRSTKTRNDLLYLPLDDKSLRQAASRGDEEMVARILQVKNTCDDAEPMVAAARGGHDLVIQLLLGLGGANPDPEPVASQPAEFATPILAAIGQENIKVLELLLEQQSVDPTRRFNGETYYEIAKRRQGTNWREEEQKLKDAYDEFKTKKSKTKSPGRRERDRLREEKRARREEKSESNLSQDGEIQRKHSSKLPGPKDKRRSESHNHPSDDKRARQKQELGASTAIGSDREASPAVAHKHAKVKRTESEVAMSSEGESVKPRRKLVSKGELRGDREKRRRSSVTSATSTAKDPPSPRESRHEDSSDKTKISEKYHDRAKALKREESKDVSSGDSSVKRHRTSLTPEQSHNGDGEISVKRRRLESDMTEKRQKRPSSSEPGSRKAKDAIREKPSVSTDVLMQNDSRRGSVGDSSVHIKAEEEDTAMPDAKSVATADSAKLEADRKHADALEAKKQQETAKRKEEEAAELQRKADAEKEAEKLRKAEIDRRQREEQKRQAEAQARQEAEEKRRREAAEKERIEQEQRKEEERRKLEEEEERLRKEREAAEEARRVREEEERKERERRERAHREEMERKRAAREAEARRIREEQEKARLDKLPPLLRWLDICPNPKNAAYANKFRKLQGVRYDTIRPEANRTPEGREQWVLNTHAALLLGEKDLGLTRYTDWERVPASHLAKVTLWRLESRLYSLLEERTWDLGQQLDGYYGDIPPSAMKHEARQSLRQAAWERFRDMDLFFVKVSDLLYTVPNIPHLKGIKLAVTYRELIENDAQMLVWRASQKWKQDPDANRFGGFFAPRDRYFVNGVLVEEEAPKLSETSPTPFPEKQVPRRGLQQVFPDDPDYSRICEEQGLLHLLNGHKEESLPNGVHSPPTSLGDGTSVYDAESKEHIAGHDVGNAISKANGSLVNGMNGVES